jgi:AcrR family transcriptional regulator
MTVVDGRSRGHGAFGFLPGRTTPVPLSGEGGNRSAVLSRVEVADVALGLFADHGYLATSATAIAEAAGISRSTFFRHFQSKEDVIFADHEVLLEDIAELLGHRHANPYRAVCEAATLAFRRFHDRLPVARLRDRVVRQTPELRDRELVMISRYERLIISYLRRQLPEEPQLPTIRFASAVIATHNYMLRRLLRSNEHFDDQDQELIAELDRVRSGAGWATGGPLTDSPPTVPDVVVAVFPASTSSKRVAAAVHAGLDLARIGDRRWSSAGASVSTQVTTGRPQ